jgi:hypothetical protein
MRSTEESFIFRLVGWLLVLYEICNWFAGYYLFIIAYYVLLVLVQRTVCMYMGLKGRFRSLFPGYNYNDKTFFRVTRVRDQR